jgi:hypothetical protein
MKLTPEQLQEIRERCEKATAGPWKSDLQHDDPVNAPFFTGGNNGWILGGMYWGGHDYVKGDDIGNKRREDVMIAEVERTAEFIAASRTDVPALLSHIAAMEAELSDATTDYKFNMAAQVELNQDNIRDLMIATQRAEAAEPLLENLLAVIHRDGGQHTASVGIENSAAEAEKLSADRIAAESRVKELEQANAINADEYQQLCTEANIQKAECCKNADKFCALATFSEIRRLKTLLHEMAEAWDETNISFKANVLDWYPKLHAMLSRPDVQSLLQEEK